MNKEHYHSSSDDDDDSCEDKQRERNQPKKKTNPPPAKSKTNAQKRKKPPANEQARKGKSKHAKSDRAKRDGRVTAIMAVINARTISASPHADAGTNKDVIAPAAAAVTISHADDLPPVAAAVVNIPDDSIAKDVTDQLAPNAAATPTPSIAINKKKHGPISKYQEWWPEILVLKKKTCCLGIVWKSH